MTANFYLGRAYGLQVVNASYLAVWEKGEDMPDPADFPAYGFYQIEGKRRKIPRVVKTASRDKMRIPRLAKTAKVPTKMLNQEK